MKHIVIVGGGTAGWMSAIAIAGRFPGVRISVLDPKVIRPIGVGESVTGVVLQFITDPMHGLSLGDFFRRCDPTFKTGIWYKGWHGPGSEYLSPIDAPPQYFQHVYPSYTEEFYAKAAGDGFKLGDVQLYGLLMRRNTTDYFRNPDGSINSDLAFASCHFDAIKFANWLEEIAAQRANIEHLDDVLESFEQDAGNGHVTKLRTRAGRELIADFYLDCTGFHRQLFAKAYQPKWKSYAAHIRVDSAIPTLAEHDARGTDPQPYHGHGHAPWVDVANPYAIEVGARLYLLVSLRERRTGARGVSRRGRLSQQGSADPAVRPRSVSKLNGRAMSAPSDYPAFSRNRSKPPRSMACTCSSAC